MRVLLLTFVLLFFLGSAEVYAGGKQPPSPPGTKGPPPDPRIPIDGGIGFLVAAGVALGSRKLYKSFKGEQD